MPTRSVPWLKLVHRDRGANLPAQPRLFDDHEGFSEVPLSVTHSRAATGSTLGSGLRQAPTASDGNAPAQVSKAAAAAQVSGQMLPEHLWGRREGQAECARSKLGLGGQQEQPEQASTGWTWLQRASDGREPGERCLLLLGLTKLF